MKEKGIWKAYKIFNYIKLAGLWISAVSIMGMMMFIVYDVVGRNLLFGSVRGGFEIVQNYFMPLAVFPALAYVYSSGVLPRMNLLISKTRASVQHIVVYVLLVVEIFVLSFVVYFSLNYALTGWKGEWRFLQVEQCIPSIHCYS
ncbi:TRAP transporter small permease [Thalassobacillus sp. C254]|uniref:TRAP transporter small permease n=1 Tax=Thalassobacillus sp. C254 TaxID=1225341 RepID=UPI0006D0AD22|nr:TRAP transporter small permease subunit [Thalassobacillus sp. C254]